MPELPEVETVRRVLLPQVKGLQICSVDIRHPQVIAYPDAASFTSSLSGQTITDLQRRGKFLCFCLDSKDRLFLHLRMTGQLLVTPTDFPEEKHTHVILPLSDSTEIRYIDVRRFGRFWFLRKGEPDSFTGAEKLGIEPDDSRLTAAYLKEQMGSKSRPIKELLLDQSIVAGIGNIYSDEILFTARIHPEARGRDLDDPAWQRLAAAVPDVISWGIEANDISPEDYLRGKGREYRNTPGLKVYGHAGEPCPFCGEPLQKLTIAGRSSTFCPVCQSARP